MKRKAPVGIIDFVFYRNVAGKGGEGMDIRTFLAHQLQISDSALLDKMTAIAQICKLEKGESTIHIGEMQTRLYLLISGVIRCYFLDGLNQEYTDCFIIDPGYPVMTASISQPSLISAEAVTTCELLELPMQDLMELLPKHLELMWAYNAMLQKALFFHWQIKTARYTYNALQRYLWFCKNWPGVDKLANSRHIASFLGMTPETLSRSRSQARNNPEFTEMLNDPNSDWDAARIKEGLNNDVRQTGERNY